MPQTVDRVGSFRAEIKNYGLREVESGSICVAINATLLHWWDGEQWVPWSEYDQEASGDIWVVKKDGNPNDRAIESLVKYAGWDGNFESIVNETWHPTPCQVSVTEDEYKNQKRLRIAFINDYERTPGGLSNIDAGKAKELQARFGSHLRALAGNVKRNAPPPATKPTPPPRLKVAETPATAGNGLAKNGEYDSEIPF